MRFLNRWPFLTLLSLLALGVAIVCFTQLDPRSGIVDESELRQASGRVSWMQEYRYGTRFGLEGVDEWFEYPSKASGKGEVRDALRRAGASTVFVQYEERTHGPIYSSDEYHNVWSIAVGQHVVRSHAKSAKGWEADNRFAPWLGAAMTLCAVVLGLGAWRARRASRKGDPPGGPSPSRHTPRGRLE